MTKIMGVVRFDTSAAADEESGFLKNESASTLTLWPWKWTFK